MAVIWLKISKPNPISIPVCQCNKCYWVWVPKDVNVKSKKKKAIELPKCCAHCKTPVWNRDIIVQKNVGKQLVAPLTE